MRLNGAQVGFGDQHRAGIDMGRYLFALRSSQGDLDAVIAHAERVFHDDPRDQAGL